MPGPEVFVLFTGMPPASGTEASAWTGQNMGNERAEWAGDVTADAEPQNLGQRLESIGQRPSVPSQRLESLAGGTTAPYSHQLPFSRHCVCSSASEVCEGLTRPEVRASVVMCVSSASTFGRERVSAAEALVTAGNLASMMSSSNGAPLDALRALSSINSSGIVPAFGQLAQRGAMGGYPASMLQQPGMQQYLTHLPAWMMRMQVMIVLSRKIRSKTPPVNKDAHTCPASSL